ncbi:hypothetical protein H112_05045 [Trichophyton rubrum D6]|uniref:Uncharacterized protein n=3 Tax=Trichophyton TaxID=5550 RepID=A0A080WHW8_TRIRC|nr:uncharacterized protein TERG_11897 [Trichophyton rubrum CBS 118892]EZF21871.1 hypothetical protein H100_05068 [Trichophyton rubrum MR850]EZF41042.1 hypothetical protein H102_05054 [Trichophyton rubrum CBS 100081]EZF51548.1 hypothetical protein H103_05056 [Trichophyton rubrum CBS 288.86]EZF62293.1 hypothetical protein H104_05049 [Trichophyton rubrum CBS 289.86]EZF72792.1 hypothetical protein H105_05075 [Trichophyton soudanense CBS 452.61]EZF83508.1 hypothetical protein H110_05055 [Trichophy
MNVKVQTVVTNEYHFHIGLSFDSHRSFDRCRALLGAKLCSSGARGASSKSESDAREISTSVLVVLFSVFILFYAEEVNHRGRLTKGCSLEHSISYLSDIRNGVSKQPFPRTF